MNGTTRESVGARRAKAVAAFACICVAPVMGQEPVSTVELDVDVISVRLEAFTGRVHALGFDGTVLVIVDGDTLLHRGYGWADAAAAVENGPDIYYRAASITKVVTSAAILRLEDLGRLRTTDSVVAHVPDLGAAKNGVRIHHLATHTGGLAMRGTDVEAVDANAFILKMKDAPQEAPVGIEYRYTNAGISLLAAVAEEVSGQTFESFAAEEVLRPLGIERTFFWNGPDDAATSVGYFATDRRLAAAGPRTRRWGSVGATGWVARVRDYARLYSGLRRGQLLSPEATEKMFFPWHIEAYGWHVEEHSRHGVRLIHKGGDTEGFRSQILVAPEDGVEIYWASNNRVFRGWRFVSEGLLRIALGRDVVLPPAILPHSAPGAVTGSFVTAEGETIRIDRLGRGLFVTGSGSGPAARVPFFRSSETTYSSILPDGTIGRIEFTTPGEDGDIDFTVGDTVDWSARRVRDQAPGEDAVSTTLGLRQARHIGRRSVGSLGRVDLGGVRGHGQHLVFRHLPGILGN